MKKISYSLVFFLLTVSVKAQLIQASLGPGLFPNSLKIYIRSTVAQSNTNISTLQFNLGVATSVTPPASAVIRSTSITGANWQVFTRTEGGYNNYSIQTALIPIIFNMPANTDFEVMEIAFIGGPLSPQNVSLVTLPEGGSTGNQLFLCTGSYASVGNNLYYSRSGVSVTNLLSYDLLGGLTGTGTSTATISGVVLPTKFLSFYANKSDDNAKLTWTVDNEEDNNYFEIEGSIDARTFTTVQKVNALRNGRSTNTYNLTDSRISRYNASIIYYRIKQVEASGKIIYSDVRQVNLEGKNFVAALYPNPVKTITKLVIEAPEAGKATVVIRDAGGKAVKQLNLQLQKGTNQQEIDATSLAAGDYNVTIVSEKLNQTIKLTKSN